MNTATGEIYELLGDDLLKDEAGNIQELNKIRAKFMKLIPDHVLPELVPMNRAQRRDYYRKHKKEWASPDKPWTGNGLPDKGDAV